ncbi:MAG: NYN domain-containing protein [Balneolaceae bacterium]|jgi:uncharacterized LabA/DUF88 family protein|nr:MAG: NYN domain-containing protein [Balneolaceae bacterium]
MKSRKVGIYVDAVDVTLNGGFGLRYDILRKFACRDGSVPSRLHAYLAFDKDRAKEDQNYKVKTSRFCEVLRDFEYKVIEKPMKFNPETDSRERLKKSALDIHMATDILTQSAEMDRIIILTNEEAFINVVNALQNMGIRVEMIGFDNVPPALKRSVDMFISGYTIPGLLPVKSPYEWGTVGSRVRGVCYDFSHSDGYGFLRYMARIDDNLWITDSRSSESPYKTVFAHVSQFEPDFDSAFLPSRDLIFEFDLVQNEKGLVAEDIVLISAP